MVWRLGGLLRGFPRLGRDRPGKNGRRSESGFHPVKFPTASVVSGPPRFSSDDDSCWGVDGRSGGDERDWYRRPAPQPRSDGSWSRVTTRVIEMLLPPSYLLIYILGGVPALGVSRRNRGPWRCSVACNPGAGSTRTTASSACRTPRSPAMNPGDTASFLVGQRPTRSRRSVRRRSPLTAMTARR